MHDELPLTQGYEDPGQNTSDEDQEDLPYDGDIGSSYFNHTADSQGSMSSDGRETIHGSPDAPGLLELTAVGKDNKLTGDLASIESESVKALRSKEEVKPEQYTICNALKTTEDGAPPCRGLGDEVQRPDFNQLLLRHFPQEELLNSGRLIEAETLPEVSLLESMDETLFSRAPRHNSTEIPRNDISTESFCQAYGEKTEKSNSASEIPASLKEGAEEKSDNITSTATDSITSKSKSQTQRVSLVRTRSFSEVKYGQGQVHYPLPDFSKVAPKVKIPKTPSGPTRPTAQSPGTMHRAQSSPGMLEVISRVLEDSVHEEPTPQSNIEEVDTTYPSQPDQQGLSDGERMTTELQDIICQFMQRVTSKTCQNIDKPLLNSQRRQKKN
uniref:Uncharacterized protein n=1 Tax=Myripristis murdjan TaxID=586833 RepID=A0A667WPH0_9TELE